MARRKKKAGSMRERVRRRASMDTGGFATTMLNVPEGRPMFWLKEPGRYVLDIIPYEAGKGNPAADVGETYYERTFWAHRGIGVNNDWYVCPAKTAGKPCPICEYANQRIQNHGKDDREARSLKPSKRQLFNVVVGGSDQERSKGVRLWEVPFHNFGKRLNLELQSAEGEDEDLLDFAEAVGGSTLRCVFDTQSFNTADGGGGTTIQVSTIRFKPRPDVDDEILEQAICLDDALKIPTYKELQAAFYQEDPDDEEAPDEADPDEEEYEEEESEVEEADSDDEWADSDDDGEEEESEEEESEVESDDEWEDDDGDSDEESEEEEKPEEESESEDDDYWPDDDDDEEPEPEPKKASKKKTAKKKVAKKSAPSAERTAKKKVAKKKVRRKN